LLETSEIKRLWPAYNYALKKPESIYGIFEYYDRQGFLHLGINKAKKINNALITFSNLPEARNFLLEKINEYRLCLKMCSLQKSSDACLNHKDGLCEGACIKEESSENYNERAKKAVLSFKNDTGTFALIGDGREKHEASVILSQKGQCIAYGYTERDQLDLNDHQTLFKNIVPYPHYSYTGNLLYSMIGKTSGQKIVSVDEETINMAFNSFNSTALNLWS
jgi:DNA polymerase-3 subunit epsilon